MFSSPAPLEKLGRLIRPPTIPVPGRQGKVVGILAEYASLGTAAAPVNEEYPRKTPTSISGLYMHTRMEHTYSYMYNAYVYMQVK